jgi:hypothetical protein
VTRNVRRDLACHGREGWCGPRKARYAGGVDKAKLEIRLVAAWRDAGEDLGIAVTAPAELRDAAGQPFWCEAFVPDFGSPAGGLVLSERTARRVREQLRSGDFCYSIHPTRVRTAYERSTFIAELVDWGWFGAADAAPDWWPVGRL